MNRTLARLRRELRRGIFGMGWRGAGICVALAVANYVASLGYDYLNHGPYRLFLRSPIDVALPMLPVFVIPYDSLQPYIYASLTVFLLLRARVFQSAVLSMIATFLVAYVFYALVQTYVDRPTLTGDDVYTRMVRAVYAGDQPYNDFPSLHVATSTLIAIHWWRFGRWWTLPLLIWTALIVASTVLIRQHYVADVAAGLVLAAATSWLFLRWLDREPLQVTVAPAPEPAAR